MRAAALQGFATATDLADYLVKRGLPSATPMKSWPTPYATANSAAATWPT